MTARSCFILAGALGFLAGLGLIAGDASATASMTASVIAVMHFGAMGGVRL